MLERCFLSVCSTSLTISLIIIALFALTPLIDRRYAAKWKYWVWILLAVRLLLPFSASDVQTALRSMSQSNAVQAQTHARSGSVDAAPSRPAHVIMLKLPSGVAEPLAQSERFTWLAILEAIWLAGGILFIGIHLYSYGRYRRRVMQYGVPIEDAAVMRIYHALSESLQLKGELLLIEYPEADGPMVMGLIRPALVMPSLTYSEEDLFFILKHELIHYKRRDVWLKLLFILANAVHWYNPLIWLMRHMAVTDMELSCDERVTAGADDTVRRAYTETLYRTLRHAYRKRTPFSTQFYGGKQVMKKRFQNILGYTGRRSGACMLIGTAFLMLGLGLLIGCSVQESGDAGYIEETSSRGDAVAHEDVSAPETAQEQAQEPAALDLLPAPATTLTYLLEGEPEAQEAALYIGDGYMIYIPADDWLQKQPDLWQMDGNERIRFWIKRYDQQDMEQTSREVRNAYGMVPEAAPVRENELMAQNGDLITRVRLIEQPADPFPCTWAVFYAYPEEAIEGAGARLPVIVDTFCDTAFLQAGR